METVTRDGDAPQEAAINADRLRLWFEGERAVPGSIDVFAEEGTDLGRLSDLDLGPSAVIFASEVDSAGVSGAARVVPYTGRLELCGGEVALAADVLVQTESYATAPYVSIAVPTAFAVTDDIDLGALRADAAAAEASGVFPDYLTTPLITVVDQHGWLAPLMPSAEGIVRLLLRADGSLVDGPLGAPVSGSPIDLVASGTEHPADATQLARFIGAAKVIRALQVRTQEPVSVAGFGDRPQSGDSMRNDTVFIAASGGDRFVIDIATNRIDRVPDTVAGFVEETLNGGTEGTVDPETSMVFRALGLERLLGAGAGAAAV